MGNTASFRGDYVGVSVDPGREDVRWLTGMASDAGASKY